MFMHMPRKLGVTVLITVAVCLGLYYVLVIHSELVGDWRVHQGRGRLRFDRQQGGSYLDVNYNVVYPDKPLFSYVRRFRAPGDDTVAGLTFEYQSEWQAALLMVVSERDGARYRARVELEHAESWKRVAPSAADFVLWEQPGNTDRNGRVDLDDLDGRIEFYDGSGVRHPSTTFENHLKITPPVPDVRPKPVETPVR